MVVIAITGMTALMPTMEAIKNKKKIGLVNKEIVVSAGEILMNEARKNGVEIIPIDSEHSGLFQCIQPGLIEKIEKIIITASGGPFYNLKDSALDSVSIEEALNHPNWQMGKKITVDSATLMNKGLEIIEAKWFFGIPADKIEIIIHPQSYIHSMVQFIDGSILAQISEHDMKIPIQFSLFYPERVGNKYPIIDFTKIRQFTFKEPNYKKFPCLKLAYRAIEIGGTMPAVLNGANEIAVSAFLNNQIKITDIPYIIQNAMKNHKAKSSPNIAELLDADYWARQEALTLCIKKINSVGKK